MDVTLLQWLINDAEQIFLLPRDLLKFMPTEHQSALAVLVTTVLVLQIYLLVGFFLYVLSRRLRRLWSRRQNIERGTNLHAALKSYLRDHGRVPKIARADSLFFRRIILDQLESGEPAERAQLQTLYRELRYLAKDLQYLRSRDWAVRLEAIIRLEIVGLFDASSAIYELVSDSNDLVAIAAIRALSILEAPENIEKILDSLARRAPQRKDIFVEILTNLGKNHANRILTYLDSCFDPSIAVICLSVLADLKDLRAISICRHLLKSSVDEVVREAIRALGKLQDRASLGEIREHLNSENAEIRAEAMIALLSMGDQNFALQLDKLQQDPSPVVRRLVFERAGGVKR